MSRGSRGDYVTNEHIAYLHMITDNLKKNTQIFIHISTYSLRKINAFTQTRFTASWNTSMSQMNNTSIQNFYYVFLIPYSPNLFRGILMCQRADARISGLFLVLRRINRFISERLVSLTYIYCAFNCRRICLFADLSSDVICDVLKIVWQTHVFWEIFILISLIVEVDILCAN